MPGPGPHIPGFRAGHAPPPKPVAKPRTAPPPTKGGPLVPIPAEPIAAWRAFWHELGSNLPWYINHSRASRRALNRFVRAGG